PFAGQSPAQVAFVLQNFLFLRTIAVYVIALSIEKMGHDQSLLRESEERFRALVDCTPLMIWTSGRDKLCDYFNQNWLKFTGRTLEEELGNGWAEAVHPQDMG